MTGPTTNFIKTLIHYIIPKVLACDSTTKSL